MSATIESAASPTIVETLAAQFFRIVLDERTADHVWLGVEVKRAKGGTFVDKKNARPILVRKLGCRVVGQVS